MTLSEEASALWPWSHSWLHAVASPSEPGAGPAPLALLGERVPALDLARPAPEHVLEPAERAAPVDRDCQAISALGIGDGPDEQLHVAVGLVRTLTPDP